MADVTSSYQILIVDNKQFRDATTEALFQQIAESINWTSDYIDPDPLGTIIVSMHTEAALQADLGPGWVLCDGDSVVGSAYEALTGNTTAPDFRGRFLRGANDGGSAAGTRADAFANPVNQSPGDVQADAFGSHSHVHRLPSNETATRSPDAARALFESTSDVNKYICDEAGFPNPGSLATSTVNLRAIKVTSQTNVHTGITDGSSSDPDIKGSISIPAPVTTETAPLCYLVNYFIRIN